MSKNSILKLAKKDIFNTFQENKTYVYSRQDLEKIFFDYRTYWRLSFNTYVKDLINFLIKEGKLKQYTFEFPDRKIVRYVWERASLFKIISTLRENSYFSHYSAVYLHGLTEQFPKTIYLNYEQSKKPRNTSSLKQENIDKAFRNNQRITNNIAILDDIKVMMLNGMNTNNSGVSTINEDSDQVPVTNLERTLIDITVRPNYSGGVFEVLKAYEKAKDKLSVNKLVAILKKVNYIYPYHQAIGFYLSKAGYSDSQINLLKKIEIKYDFYLTHKIEDMEYSKEWRLFFPKNF